MSTTSDKWTTAALCAAMLAALAAALLPSCAVQYGQGDCEDIVDGRCLDLGAP